MTTYYPPLGFYFNVSFERINTLAEDFRFQSVAGLSSELITETYREGGQNQFEHVLPVKTQYPDLVLKRGLLVPKAPISNQQSRDLQSWCQQTMQNLLVKPTDLMITLLNTAGRPLMSWSIVHAWPKKWMVSDFNAEENQIVIETMEFSYHYFKLL